MESRRSIRGLTVELVWIWTDMKRNVPLLNSDLKRWRWTRAGERSHRRRERRTDLKLNIQRSRDKSDHLQIPSVCGRHVAAACSSSWITGNMEASDKVQMFHVPSHYTSVPTQTRRYHPQPSRRRIAPCFPSRPLTHFFFLLWWNIIHFPRRVHPSPTSTHSPYLQVVWKNVICNFLQTMQNVRYIRTKQKTRKKEKENPPCGFYFFTFSPSCHPLLSVLPRKTPPRFTLPYPQCSAGWPFVWIMTTAP